MTKESFIKFIKELGFTPTWQTKPNYFSMATDVVNQPNQNFGTDQLNIHFDDTNDLIQLSLSQMSTHMMSGKSFGNFSLNTFGDDGDFQMQIFMSFIKGSFNKVPNNIVEYMRDKNINDILKI